MIRRSLRPYEQQAHTVLTHASQALVLVVMFYESHCGRLFTYDKLLCIDLCFHKLIRECCTLGSCEQEDLHCMAFVKHKATSVIKAPPLVHHPEPITEVW